MQPTQDGALADGTAHDSRSSPSRDLLLDSLMRSLTIMEGNVLLQNPLDLSSANEQEIVQCFSSHRPEEPLQDTVHIRSLDSGSDRYQIARQEVDIEHQRIVMDQIRSAGYGFGEKYQLLSDKLPGGSSVMANRTISRVLYEIAAKT